ncbi:Uncharacterised protein [Mycobacterium tuberculosis]|nr:Uncharacterised protein [Mycobacterium tuberculosis]
MAAKATGQVDYNLRTLLMFLRWTIGQRIANCDKALVGAAIGKLDPAHLQGAPVHQANEIVDHFETAFAAVPGRAFDAAILAVDADGGQEVLRSAD